MRSLGVFLVTALVVLVIFPYSAFPQASDFLAFVSKRIADEAKKTDLKQTLASLCPIETDALARRVFLEYGSMFAASKDVRLATSCIFRSPLEVDIYQRRLETKKHIFAGVEIELQEEAMEKLLEAKKDAEEIGLTITPLDGAIAGRRSYTDTVRIWSSRFYRALSHWERQGRISASEADIARSATVSQQIAHVIEWERQSIWFSTNFSKSIFHSVAPPGTSQHLSLLAFDVVEAGNPTICQILNQHGWFQTIRTDQPHFTYIGVDEIELPARGLRKIVYQGNFYWVPNFP